MRGLRYWLDIDGVLADTNAGVARGWERAGLGLPEVWPPQVYDLGVYGPERERVVLALFADPWFYLDLEPLPGAVEAARLLAHRDELAGYLTSRHCIRGDGPWDDGYLATLAWLGRHGFPRRPLAHSKWRPKWLHLMPDEGLIDDNPLEVAQCLAHGFFAVQVGHYPLPATRKYRVAGVVRVGSLAEFVGVPHA